MNDLRKALAKYAEDLVIVVGCASISAGAGLIYPPAGLIVGGILAIAGAVLSILGGGRE